jgi:hypothetical protein
MGAFVIFSPSSGEILGSYSTSNAEILDEIASANTPAGASALTVPAGHGVLQNQSGWQIVAGVLTPIVLSAAQQLANAQAAQLLIVAAASAAAQTSGYTSSALGSAYSYPSGITDQANLTACITASLIAPAGTPFLFWCTSAAGVSGFVSHTAAQIQAVGLAALAAIMAAKQKQLTLSQQVAAASTVAAVQAVVWA